MKRTLVVLGLVAVLGGGAIVGWNKWSDSQETKSASGQGYTMMTSAELAALVNQKKDMQIIDLREPSCSRSLFMSGNERFFLVLDVGRNLEWLS